MHDHRHAHTCIHICTRAHMLACTHSHAYTPTCTPDYTHTCTHMLTCTRMLTYTHMHAHVHTHTCTRANTSSYVCAHPPTHVQAAVSVSNTLLWAPGGDGRCGGHVCEGALNAVPESTLTFGKKRGQGRTGGVQGTPLLKPKPEMRDQPLEMSGGPGQGERLRSHGSLPNPAV